MSENRNSLMFEGIVKSSNRRNKFWTLAWVGNKLSEVSWQQSKAASHWIHYQYQLMSIPTNLNNSETHVKGWAWTLTWVLSILQHCWYKDSPILKHVVQELRRRLQHHHQDFTLPKIVSPWSFSFFLPGYRIVFNQGGGCQPERRPRNPRELDLQ